MNDSIRKHCRFITENYNQIFLRKRNVVGMGYGYKISNGFNTGELCFKVFVAKKESKASLNEDNIIPNIYKGMKTDVIQTGKFKKSSLTEKKSLLPFGFNIGPKDVDYYGTAGCLVTDCKGNYYILSNNHILAGINILPIGTPILHPSSGNGGKFPDDVIAHLSKSIPLIEVDYLDDLKDYKKEDYNYVDCAIAKIDNPCLVTKKIASIGTVKGVRDAELNMKVKKTGATTGFTTGIITELDAFFEVESNNDKIEVFDKQIVATSMDAGGDSGSLLLDEYNNAVGLLFSGTDSDVSFNPIKEVLKALNVKIITC